MKSEKLKVYASPEVLFMLFWAAVIYSNTFLSSFHPDDPYFIVKNNAIMNIANLRETQHF